jgi:hypothetical protein
MNFSFTPGGRWTNCHLWQLIQPPVTVSPPVVWSKIGSNFHKAPGGRWQPFFFSRFCWKRLGPNGLMMTWEDRKLEKLLIFLLTVLFSMIFSENTLDQLSQFIWAKVGRTVTFWQLVLDFGVQIVVFRVDEQFLHFGFGLWLFVTRTKQTADQPYGSNCH